MPRNTDMVVRAHTHKYIHRHTHTYIHPILHTKTTVEHLNVCVTLALKNVVAHSGGTIWS